MRVDQLVVAVTAMHIARNAYARTVPPSGLAPDEAGRAPSRSRLAPARVMSAAHRSESGSAYRSPEAQAVAPGRRKAWPLAGPSWATTGLAARKAAQPVGTRPPREKAYRADGQHYRMRSARHTARASRRKNRNGVPAAFLTWLGRVVSSQRAAAALPLLPPRVSPCGAGSARTPAAAPQAFYTQVRTALIDANVRKAGGRASQERVARQVDFARAQLAWICGAETGAEERQTAWSSVPAGTRSILREMQQLFSLWSPGAAATVPLRNLTISAMAGGKGVPAFTADQICRYEWLRGAQSMVARHHAKTMLHTPLDNLVAVYQFRATPVSRAIDLDMQLRPDVDAECLEAARLLYEQARDPYFVPDYSGGLPAAQQSFRVALQEDLAEWSLASELIPLGGPTYRFTAIWFDGMALREAAGKNASQIAAALHGRGMPLEQARRLVRRRFHDLGESPDYLIGTPQQSMASMVIRLGPHAGISADGLEKVACLMEKFQLLEDRLMAAGTYPLSPTLLAARHSARSSGILASSVLTAQQLLTREVRTHLLAGTAEWRAQPSGGNPALSFRWNRLEAMARAEHPPVDEPFRQAAVTMYKFLWSHREIIIEPTVEALNRALIAVFAERVLAYAPIPQFDEAQGAFDLLVARFGLCKAEIELPRPYFYRVLARGTRIPQSRPVVRVGSWVQEVLDRRRYAIEDDKKIAHRGAVLDTRADLDRALQQFNRGLPDTIPLQARAKEVLRMRQQALAPRAIAQLAEGIARNAQVRASDESLPPLAILFARGMQVVGVLSPLEHIIDTIASGDPARIVDMLPFLGGAYQIEQGMWHRNWRQAGMGVARLGADAVFAWITGLAEDEIVSTLAAALRPARGLPFEAPAVSMLRDFQRDSPAPAEDRIGPETQADAGPDETRFHEVRYGEHGAGAPNEGRVSPAFPPQFGDRPLSPEIAERRRTVEDCRALLNDMRLASERTAQLERLVACNWRDCLPFVKPAAMSLEIDDLIFSEDSRLAALIADMTETFAPSPTFRRLLAYGRSIENMPRWEVVHGGDHPPVTMLGAGRIHMPEDGVITGQSFVGSSQPWPFGARLTLLHEFTHAMTLRRDNPGPHPWLDRGPIIPIHEQIYYERNMAIPQRIAYQRHFTAAESPDRHAQASAAHPVALLETLKENVELDGMFAHLNRHLSSYTILGTLAKKRVTLAESLEVVSQLLNTICERPLVQDTPYEFGERVIASGLEPGDAPAIQTELRLTFEDLVGLSDLFAATAELWLEQTAGTSWQFVFDAHDLADTPLSAWRIDRRARTVHFNRRPLYYLDRGGPQVLTHERSLAGLFIELVYGDAFSSAPFDAALNRGPAILIENLMFDEIGLFQQRVSAELSDSPAELWPSVGPASKAAADEDVRLESLVSRVSPQALRQMVSVGDFWV